MGIKKGGIHKHKDSRPRRRLYGVDKLSVAGDIQKPDVSSTRKTSQTWKDIQ